MEPGRLQSMGSLRVGHDWATSLSLVTFMHWRRKWQPTLVFLPGESQGRGSLVGWHLWSRTESDSSSNKEDTGTKTEMITVGFKPAKAEIQVSTPDDTVPGQHRADFRDVPGESDQQQRKKMWILTTTQLNSGLLQMLSIPEFTPISPGLPSIPGKPVLWYLLLSPVITCVFTSLIDCGFYRAETKLYWEGPYFMFDEWIHER